MWWRLPTLSASKAFNMVASSERQKAGSEAPLRVTHDPGGLNILYGFICLVLMLICGVIGPFNYFRHQGDPYYSPEGDILLFVGFCLGALFWVAWIVWAFRSRKKKKRVYFVKGGDILCFDGYGLLWSEPQQGYRQVRWHQKTQQGVPMDSLSNVIEALTLDHPRKDRSFEIYSDETGKIPMPILEWCECWAEALNLPVFRENMEQGLMLSADELKKPLVKLAAEGRLVTDFSFTTPPPKGLTWGRSTGFIWVKARVTRFIAIIGVLTAFLGVSELVHAGNYLGINPSAVFFFGLTVVIIVVPLVTRQAVCISSKEIIVECRCLGLALFRQHLLLEAITRIYLSRDSGVVLEGRDTRIQVLFLSNQVQRWLMAFLQAAILEQQRT